MTSCALAVPSEAFCLLIYHCALTKLLGVTSTSLLRQHNCLLVRLEDFWSVLEIAFWLPGVFDV